MALEVEGRKNRDTHRLFSTLESTLGDAVKGMEARSVSSRYLKLFKLSLKFDPANTKSDSIAKGTHTKFSSCTDFFHYYELKLYMTD